MNLMLMLTNKVEANTFSSYVLDKEEIAMSEGESETIYISNYQYRFDDCTWYFENDSIALVEKSYNPYMLNIKGIQAGDTILHIRNKDGNTDSYKVHIYKNYTSFALSKENYEIYLGSEEMIKYTMYPIDCNCKVSFKKVNAQDEDSFSLADDGKIIPYKAGTYYFSVEIEDEYVDVCRLEIKKTRFQKQSYTIYKNESVQLKLYGKNKKTTFSSSDKSKIKVDKNGKIIALKAGTAVITANTNGYKASTKVIVKNPELSCKSKTLVAKEKYTIKVNGWKGKVKWKSSNTKVAKISSKGRITALKAGNTTITAMFNGKKLKCKIKVKANQIKYDIDKDASSYGYGNPKCIVSKVYYSGNDIKMDVWVINNRMFYASKFKYLKFYIYDFDENLIAYKKFKNVKLNIKKYGSKKITLKFTGNSVKNKNAILNNGIDCDYDYKYIYNY